MGQKIIVVGAGITGAAAAYNLQKAGAQVTIVDAGKSNATQNSFGWINASFFENTAHFHLRAASIAAYRDLCRDLTLPVNWCGSLCWEETGTAFDAHRDALTDLGYPVEEINADQFAKLEPHIAAPPDRCLMFRQEAAAESGPLADCLKNAAVALGARVISGVTVQNFVTEGDKIGGVNTDVGQIKADQTLLAVGTGTQAMMAQLDIPLPMLKRPALMLQTKPVAPILHHVLVSEIGELRQLPGGSLLMPAAIGHQSDDSDALSHLPHEEADRALERLQALLPDVPLSWSHASVAYRPVPEDRLPVVGSATPGLYVATMHSGITLGALIGDLIATEMLMGPTNETSKMLAPLRPARFAKHQERSRGS
jgi:glycine/D-amino acid oxidase-like deaminating enzyme